MSIPFWKRKNKRQATTIDHFMSTNPREYRALFGSNIPKVTLNSLNCSILFAVLAFLSISGYTKDRHPGHLVMMLLGHSLLGRNFWFKRLKPALIPIYSYLGVGIPYLLVNSYVLTLKVDRYDIFGAQLKSGVGFGIMLTMLVFSLIAFTSSIPLTVLLNSILLYGYYKALTPILIATETSLGFYYVQNMILCMVISTIMVSIIRFRVITGIQEKGLRDHSDIIEKSAQKIRRIFDSIEQAIFTIVLDNKQASIPSDGRSPYATSLLGLDESSDAKYFEAFVARTSLEAEEKSITQEVVLAILESDQLSWDMNHANLPNACWIQSPLGKRHLLLNHAPIIERNGTVSSIIVTALDDTDRIAMQARAAEGDWRVARVMLLVNAGRLRGERGLVMLAAMHKGISQAILGLGQSSSPPVIREVLKNQLLPMHTMKGNARSLGLQDLSHGIHDMESKTIELKKELDDGDAGAALPSGFQSRLASLASVLEAVASSIDVFQKDAELLGWSKGDDITLPKKAFLQALEKSSWSDVIQAIDEGEDQDGALEAFLAPGIRRFSNLKTAAVAACDKAARLAQKPNPKLIMEGNSVWLRAEAFDALESILPHLIANSVDHGIQPPSARRLLGLPDAGTIRIRAEHEARQHSALVTFEDDGVGIDPDEILGIARQRGLDIDPGQVTTDEGKVELIFRSGFSSKAEITELSGRGVGMSAVENAIQEQGGVARILLKEKMASGRRRFSICLELPVHLFSAFHV